MKNAVKLKPHFSFCPERCDGITFRRFAGGDDAADECQNNTQNNQNHTCFRLKEGVDIIVV